MAYKNSYARRQRIQWPLQRLWLTLESCSGFTSAKPGECCASAHIRSDLNGIDLEASLTKFDFTNPLRSRLRSGKVTFGMLNILESPSVSEMAADMGLDWVLIDMEHGSLSFRDVLDHLRALKGSETVGIVRVASASVENIKRALDVGAQGVFIPLVRTREDVESAFRHARFPPVGERGLGGDRSVRWGNALQEYVDASDNEIMVIPIIETADCIRNIDDILAVPGIDATFIGPGDLAQSMGFRGKWGGGVVEEAIQRATSVAHARKIATGVIGRDLKELDERIAEGHTMIGFGSDIKIMMAKLREMLAHVRRYR